jgi:hypothetical protein
VRDPSLSCGEIYKTYMVTERLKNGWEVACFLIPYLTYLACTNRHQQAQISSKDVCSLPIAWVLLLLSGKNNRGPRVFFIRYKGTITNIYTKNDMKCYK